MIWDLEFLHDANGRRVAAMGRPAGVNGCAVGLLTWCAQQTGEALESLSSWSNVQQMVTDVKAKLGPAVEKAGRSPRIHVMGALGRCGKTKTKYDSFLFFLSFFLSSSSSSPCNLKKKKRWRCSLVC